MAETLSIYIIDTSGSMGRHADEMSQAINGALAEQKGEDIHLDMVEFATEVRPWYNGPVGNVRTYCLRAGGLTALMDAVGQTIDRVGNELAAMSEEARPNVVTVTIITDGAENASREYSRTEVRDKIAHQQGVYNWHFFYLGANQDAFKVGADMGIGIGTTSNADAAKLGEGFALSNAKVTGMTRASKGGASKSRLEQMSNFSDAERKSLNE